MRIPDNTHKCVTFFARVINKGSQVEKVFGGTGFLVDVPSSQIQGLCYTYAVTAKHVAAQMLLGDWVMRVNTQDRSFLDIRGTKDHEWWYHPTEAKSVDVAVSPIVLPNNTECTPLPESMFLTAAIIEEANIGAGDEVVISGLFTKIPGKSRILPIVRTGNIAMMTDPCDLVPGVVIDEQPVDAEAYLIEARSVGGLSGSPVFVRSSIPIEILVQPIRDGIPLSQTLSPMWCQMTGRTYFLGLAHGHWEILAEDKNELHPRHPNRKERERKEKEIVNLGIAVVFPAKKIREVLYQPGLVEERARRDQAILTAQRTPTPD